MAGDGAGGVLTAVDAGYRQTAGDISYIVSGLTEASGGNHLRGWIRFAIGAALPITNLPKPAGFKQ